jgi:exportin-1
MSPAQLKLVIDSIIWAFRHTERNVADTGARALPALLTPLRRPLHAGTTSGSGLLHARAVSLPC